MPDYITAGFYTITSITHSVFYYAISHRYKCAVWQQPGSKRKFLLLDVSTSHEKKSFSFEKSGFLIAGFEDTKGENTHWLRQDLLLEISEKQVEIRHASPQGENALQYIIQEGNKNPLSELEVFDEKVRNDSSTEHEYGRLVALAVEEINRTDLKKVVVSRAKTEKLPESFDPVPFYENLCHHYPTAFVAMAYTPETGLWAGVSPELLLAIDDQTDRIRTVALAASQPVPDDKPITGATWSQKEIEEQALVSRYIAEVFQHAGGLKYQENGPVTVQAGNLLHLRTDFAADVFPHPVHEAAKQILNRLHPTSAVCGMPRKLALDFIAKYEGYQRGLYSGYWGPVNLSSDKEATALYVNIRCAKIYREHFTIYAGAGITAQSDPAKEWKETELKMATLLSLLQNQQ